MLKKFLFAFVLILISACCVGMAPAYAQATRTWVSGVGDDVNPCSRTAPCKTFAGAISKTAVRGEINCLDSAGYGAVTITKSISIICNGVIGGVLVSGTNAIIVNLPGATDRVLLDGLDLNGLGTGLDGVRIVGSGQVTIMNTTIQGFVQEAIDLAGAAGARVNVLDSLITNNLNGINVLGNGAVANVAIVDNVRLLANTNYALQVSATGTATISNSYFAGSANSLVIAAGGVVTSYGGNIIRNPGLPTQTLPKQ